MRVYYDISETWINNAQKEGLVLTNGDYSAVMVLTPVDRSAELDAVEPGDKFAFLETREIGDNFTHILQYIGTANIEAMAVQTHRQGQKLGSTTWFMLRRPEKSKCKG